MRNETLQKLCEANENIVRKISPISISINNTFVNVHCLQTCANKGKWVWVWAKSDMICKSIASLTITITLTLQQDGQGGQINLQEAPANRDTRCTVVRSTLTLNLILTPNLTYPF